MSIAEFRKIQKMIMTILNKMEKEAIEEGVDITTPDFQNKLKEVKETLLRGKGLTIAEYEEIKTQLKKEKEQKKEQSFNKVKEDVISIIKPDIDSVREEIRSSHKVILDALEVLKKKPPKTIVKREVVEQIVKEKPITKVIKTIERIKEIDPSKLSELRKDLYALQESHAEVYNRLNDIPKFKEIVKEVEKNFSDSFSENFEKNMDIMGMPDFRKLGMGLQQQIDTRIIGDPTKKITISDTEPSNPSVGDLWVDTSS